jgi:hypothetical protein
LNRRLGGPQSLSGHCGRKKNLASARNRTAAVQAIAHPYINRAILTPSNIYTKCNFSKLNREKPKTLQSLSVLLPVCIKVKAANTIPNITL